MSSYALPHPHLPLTQQLTFSFPHSSCLAVPTASTTGYTLSAASQLPTASTSSRVVRNGTKLQLAGVDFKVVGPNVYWLGASRTDG